MRLLPYWNITALFSIPWFFLITWNLQLRSPFKRQHLVSKWAQRFIKLIVHMIFWLIHTSQNTIHDKYTRILLHSTYINEMLGQTRMLMMIAKSNYYTYLNFAGSSIFSVVVIVIFHRESSPLRFWPWRVSIRRTRAYTDVHYVHTAAYRSRGRDV